MANVGALVVNNTSLLILKDMLEAAGITSLSKLLIEPNRELQIGVSDHALSYIILTLYQDQLNL